MNSERVVERCGPAGKWRFLMVVAILAELVWVLLAALGVVDVSIFALPLAVYAGLGLPLLRRTSATRRTASGRDLWSRVGGFRRMLATPSAEARFDFSGGGGGGGGGGGSW